MSFPLSRAFIALPLEGEAKEAYREVQERLEPYAKLFRFQNPASPHLTLYFWKELMEIEYEDIVKKVENIAARAEPFTMHVSGVGTFEDRRPPRVLFLTVDRSEELSCLKKQCPWPNMQPFHAHVTVARMQNPHTFIVHQKKIMKLVKDVAFEIPCDRIRLYGEVEGVKQTPIRDFLLTQASSS